MRKFGIRCNDVSRILIFTSLITWDAVDFQIKRHYDRHQTKVEMTIDKLQAIATSEVSAKTKAKWLRWWNGSASSRKTLKFPPSPCSIEVLNPWITKAAFWANVSVVHHF